MYDIYDHGRMIADRVRGDAYARAIRSTVRPGDTVVDLGTGTGLFAILACRAGARRVYAIEADGIIEVAREIAAANGCRDRIEFIQSDSRQVELADKADVLIADLRGTVPFFTTSLDALIDARNRFLAEDGVVIPRQDVMLAALVESPGAYAVHDQPWASRWEGIDLTPARRLTINGMKKRLIEQNELIAESSIVVALDYETVATTDFEATIELRAIRDGIAHGFALWFDTVLAPGIGFSNGPGSPPAIYGRSFVPFEAAVDLRQGDSIVVDLAARFVAGDDDYLWRWNTAMKRGGEEPRPLFRQSTFFGYAQKFGMAE
ncbi:MAG TPA: 50S ribosomal protein L11 methyltransferase [Thermoanaerobaculia bacterium]|nr:50S ribosomal protein L11 methyltransferase [Thermoanaerobaculia bacterium]